MHMMGSATEASVVTLARDGHVLAVGSLQEMPVFQILPASALPLVHIQAALLHFALLQSASQMPILLQCQCYSVL